MQNVLEVARTAENFALNTTCALKLSRFSSPDLASLKCHAFLCPTPKWAEAPWEWGKGTGSISDYDLALSPPSPQFHFPKDITKEFKIVYQKETVVKWAF